MFNTRYILTMALLVYLGMLAETQDFFENSSLDVLWPSESTLQSSRNGLQNKITKEILWFYDMLDSQDKLRNNILKEHLLFGSTKGKGVDWVVSLDTNNTDIAILLETSLSTAYCKNSLTQDEVGKYVYLPRELSSDRSNPEIRCFKTKKCSKLMPLMTEIATSDGEGSKKYVEFNCIENFESQLTASVQHDFKIVSQQLENWATNSKIVSKNIDPFNIHLIVDVPQKKMLNQDWDPNTVSTKMLNKDWDPNSINTRALQNDVAKPLIVVGTVVDTEPDATVKEHKVIPMEKAKQDKLYDVQYISALESSYENKVNIMIWMYVVTLVIALGLVMIVIWYCKKRISEMGGGNYHSETLKGSPYEERLTVIKKDDRVNRRDESDSTPISMRQGSISTIGQVSSGSLQRKYNW